jgi:hypothetical protein
MGGLDDGVAEASAWRYPGDDSGGAFRLRAGGERPAGGSRRIHSPVPDHYRKIGRERLARAAWRVTNDRSPDKDRQRAGRRIVEWVSIPVLVDPKRPASTNPTSTPRAAWVRCCAS